MVSKEEALKELNLNEKEINIYLSLLMLGKSSVSRIAKKAELNRITTYDILKSLATRGIVSHVIMNGIKFYEAVDPVKFLDDLKEKQEKIETVLPELTELKRTLVEKPQIEMFEEISGLKSIFADMLKENKDMMFIGTSHLGEKLQFYFPHFAKQKRKQGIFSRFITHDCKAMRRFKKKTPKKYSDVRFIEEDIEITKIIYGHKVAYLTFKEKESIGILIENAEIANSEKILFEIMWRWAKE